MKIKKCKFKILFLLNKNCSLKWLKKDFEMIIALNDLKKINKIKWKSCNNAMDLGFVIYDQSIKSRIFWE